MLAVNREARRGATSHQLPRKAAGADTAMKPRPRNDGAATPMICVCVYAPSLPLRRIGSNSAFSMWTLFPISPIRRWALRMLTSCFSQRHDYLLRCLPPSGLFTDVLPPFIDRLVTVLDDLIGPMAFDGSASALACRRDHFLKGLGLTFLPRNDGAATPMK